MPNFSHAATTNDNPVITWLRTNAPGFNELPPKERDAIMHFSLLWSLFEANALENHASVKAIRELVQSWEKKGRLELKPFHESLEYFKARYFKDGEQTRHFHRLNLRDNDEATLVLNVLKGDTENQTDCVTAILIIVYRYRNNLLHGEKWAYELRDQLGNFTHANSILMKAIEINRDIFGS